MFYPEIRVVLEDSMMYYCGWNSLKGMKIYG